MALDRKDVRAKLDDDVHTALKAICDVDGIDMGLFIEQLIVPEVRKRIHDAMLLADKLQSAGIAGKTRANPGTSGSRDR